MSWQGYPELQVLNIKLEELLNRYRNLLNENEELKKKNEALSFMLQERENRIKELETEYERIKLTGALRGDAENAQEARKKITELVREIDKCVALLNR
ncbi:MAG: hypothetical protein HPY62_03055 [Bacteroidales bacterium]|nr:hypothetical protein [Bacteroidales bacterium]